MLAKRCPIPFDKTNVAAALSLVQLRQLATSLLMSLAKTTKVISECEQVAAGGNSTSLGHGIDLVESTDAAMERLMRTNFSATFAARIDEEGVRVKDRQDGL